MNIVRINEAIFNSFNIPDPETEETQCNLCWSFTYARKDYANLTTKDKCCVHVFMEDFTTENIRANDGLIDYILHTFTLRILIDSLLDIQIFNELQPDVAKSKFMLYVEPILNCFPGAYEAAVCEQGISILKEKISAEYNRKDSNKDGISYQVTLRQD